MGRIIIWIICGFVTAVIASRKWRSGFSWLLVCSLFGVFWAYPYDEARTSRNRISSTVNRQRGPLDVALNVLKPFLRQAKVSQQCGHRDAA